MNGTTPHHQVLVCTPNWHQKQPGCSGAPLAFLQLREGPWEMLAVWDTNINKTTIRWCNYFCNLRRIARLITIFIRNNNTCPYARYLVFFSCFVIKSILFDNLLCLVCRAGAFLQLSGLRYLHQVLLSPVVAKKLNKMLKLQKSSLEKRILVTWPEPTRKI